MAHNAIGPGSALLCLPGVSYSWAAFLYGRASAMASGMPLSRSAMDKACSGASVEAAETLMLQHLSERCGQLWNARAPGQGPSDPHATCPFRSGLASCCSACSTAGHITCQLTQCLAPFLPMRAKGARQAWRLLRHSLACVCKKADWTGDGAVP